MFIASFEKVATTLVTMSPEEFYDVVREKDPATGAVAGGYGGALAGALRGKKGGKTKAALIGAGLGSVVGGAAAAGGGKLLRHYQAKRVHRLADELNLKATPHRRKD